MTNNPQPFYPEQQQLIITLDIVPEDPHDADPAWVGAIQRDTEDALRRDGYTIRHPYTGTRGGPHPAEIITTITQALSYAYDHRTVAEEVINDLSSLVTIFSFVVAAAKHLLQAPQKQTMPTPTCPIKITVYIDDAPVSIEAPEIEQAEAALKLAQKYHNSHPNKKVTLQSSVTVTAHIPKRKPRRRR